MDVFRTPAGANTLQKLCMLVDPKYQLDYLLAFKNFSASIDSVMEYSCFLFTEGFQLVQQGNGLLQILTQGSDLVTLI